MWQVSGESSVLIDDVEGMILTVRLSCIDWQPEQKTHLKKKEETNFTPFVWCFRWKIPENSNKLQQIFQFVLSLYFILLFCNAIHSKPSLLAPIVIFISLMKCSMLAKPPNYLFERSVFFTIFTFLASRANSFSFITNATYRIPASNWIETNTIFELMECLY